MINGAQGQKRIFSKYDLVMDYEGTIIQAHALLDNVQHIATNYAVKQTLHNGLSRIRTSDFRRVKTRCTLGLKL